jgi:hypothetical protein
VVVVFFEVLTWYLSQGVRKDSKPADIRVETLDMLTTRTREILAAVRTCNLPKVSYFDVVVGLAWSNDPESYADSSVATGRASHARHVEDDDPDK